MAFLASRWAVKKFHAEKWWERKEKAYREIIEALYDSVHYFSVYKEDYGQGTGYSKQVEIELHQKYEKSYWTLKKATDMGSFYISKEAEDILEELNKKDRLDFDSNPKWDVYEHEFLLHKNTLERLIKVAKKELSGNKI